MENLRAFWTFQYENINHINNLRVILCHDIVVLRINLLLELDELLCESIWKFVDYKRIFFFWLEGPLKVVYVLCRFDILLFWVFKLTFLCMIN